MTDSTFFVLVLVGLFLIVAGVHASCPIELSPPSVVVRYGDSVTVNCTTSETLHNGIGWEAQQGGTGVEPVNILLWTVEKLTGWDNSPSCLFNSISHKQCNETLDLVIYTFPKNINIKPSREFFGELNEGDEIQLLCDIINVAPVQNLTVTWFKGSEIIHRDTFDNRTKKPVDPFSEFTFRATRQDVSPLIFSCEAVLDLGPQGPKLNASSPTYDILVKFGPDISCSVVELNENETLKETCPIKGNPTPHVKWLKDGELFEPSTPLRREDAGIYTVEAEGLSYVTRNITVVVLYGPTLSCPSTYTALENVPHNLTCTLEGFPTPQMVWYKDWEEMEFPNILTRGDAGQYMIIASNNHSSVNDTVDITVLYPPSEIVELDDSEVDMGSTVRLKCSSMSNPRPSYRWTYDQASNVMEETEDGVSFLTIQNASSQNTGSYTCCAFNERGNVSKTARVTVKDPPSEIVELDDSEVDMGSTVRLKCSSMSNPRPSYRWTYDQASNVMEETEDGVSFLTIQNASSQNTGSYTCCAFNERGNVSKTARVTVKGATPECPLMTITPNPMVVQYQSRVQSATCSVASNNPTHVAPNIHWQTHHGAGALIIFNKTWFADTHNDWDPRPVCIAVIPGRECYMNLNYTLYKTPDSVSIHVLNDTGLVKENTELQLQCSIINIAPAHKLTVQWYRGNQTIKPDVMQMIDCQSENNSSCNIAEVRSPVSVSSTISVSLNRTHHGVQFRCEAQLDLGTERIRMMSKPLNLTVFYKPIINTTKLPKRIPVFHGYPEELVCEADGHPPPKILWLYSSDKVSNVSEGKLTVYEAGFYNCTAVNAIDSTIHVVEVILKEDYLPLIAGFVAITVIVISAIFLFIYSIYYKNTKMRHYNLKNPKLSNHKGNVANNGWDLPLPMTKLT